MTQPTGRQLRDEGMQRALFNAPEDFTHAYALVARQVFDALPYGTAFTSEDIRVAVMVEPHHPNAWPGVFKRFLTEMRRAGWEISDDGYAQSRLPSRHAGIVRQYRKWSRNNA